MFLYTLKHELVILYVGLHSRFLFLDFVTRFRQQNAGAHGCFVLLMVLLSSCFRAQ